MSSEGRTGKTNKATSAGLEWLRCCPLKRVRRVRTTMCCGPVSSLTAVTELAVSWYKGQQGSRSVCGSAFPRVQLSCGTAALFSGSPFYGCHGSCSAITLQLFCHSHPPGKPGVLCRVDLASEWQLKYLCLQTTRLTGSQQKPFSCSIRVF